MDSNDDAGVGVALGVGVAANVGVALGVGEPLHCARTRAALTSTSNRHRDTVRRFIELDPSFAS